MNIITDLVTKLREDLNNSVISERAGWVKDTIDKKTLNKILDDFEKQIDNLDLDFS